MHPRPRKSLFDKLETMNLVREIESRRGLLEGRIRSANLHPSPMQYAEEMGKRADEERLAVKREFKQKANENVELPPEKPAEEKPEAPATEGEKEQKDEDPIDSRGKGEHGCEHYRRRCRLIAPCCSNAPFSCRHCHNTASDSGDMKLSHQLDRKAVQELECCLCSTRQPVSETCSTCGVRFGAYSCLICRFFDDDTSKGAFHCDGCGICRVGGRDNFFHCETCGFCYANALKETHKCVQQSMHQNCGVCMEYLFDSIKPISVLNCGHTIHTHCLDEMARHSNFYCPICHKTYLGDSSKENLWAQYDRAVQETQMPQEYAEMRVAILCNDCGSRSTCLFHVVGLKCQDCGSYNTTRC